MEKKMFQTTNQWTDCCWMCWTRSWTRCKHVVWQDAISTMCFFKAVNHPSYTAMEATWPRLTLSPYSLKQFITVYIGVMFELQLSDYELISCHLASCHLWTTCIL